MVHYTQEQEQEVQPSNIDGINVSKSKISYNANVENTLNYKVLVMEKRLLIYQPISNSLIDKGASLTNTVSSSLTTSSTLGCSSYKCFRSADIGFRRYFLDSGRRWTQNQTINLSIYLPSQLLF